MKKPSNLLRSIIVVLYWIMVLGKAISQNGISIRLTQERWMHITYSHPEIDPRHHASILQVIEQPDFILTGDKDELLAVQKSGRKKWIVVVYKDKETGNRDGFILTVYITTDVRWLLKREILWSKQS